MQRKVYVQNESAGCSEDFAELADRAFPQLIISPGMSQDEIMFNAGQRAVIEWVMAHIKNSTMDNRVNRQIAP